MSLRCAVALVVTMVMQCACANQMQDFECYDAKHPTMYTGHTTVTETGKQCLMWGSQSPHQTLGVDADDFIDEEFPSNYCRVTLNGDDADKPWCYTTDEYVSWEYCDVPQCSCTGDFVVYGSSCYAYVNTSTSWQDAQTHCSSLGAFLAEVKAADQSDFLPELTLGIVGPATWLGGTYDNVGDMWAWASSGEVMTYTNWVDGEPTYSGNLSHCLYNDVGNGWRADVCTNMIGSICQKTPNELSNGGRVNILANIIDTLQATMENLTNVIEDLTQKEFEQEQELQEARHIESGTFQCGSFEDWTSDPIQTQTHEHTFATVYPAPPTVHVSLATLDTNVNQRQLDVTFAVNGTTSTGFKVVCENHQGRHYSKLWKLDLTWMSIPMNDA